MFQKFCRQVFVFFLQAGIDLKKIIFFFRNYPRYILELFKFKKLGGVVTSTHKNLTDYNAPAGIVKGHYFHQDLLVAKYIYENKPDRHIDIGSRIDGFIAHLLTFRSVEIIDVRDLKISQHKNMYFLKKDMTSNEFNDKNIADSISCLHAIEHFGLGRYGDKLDPNGHIKGFNNIIKMLKKNGKLYISFPIGKKNAVHFNYERVFDYKDIFNWHDNKNDLVLERFDVVNDNGELLEDVDINNFKLCLNYGCGIYTFKKLN